MNKGFFISVEGTDGCGKSSQARMLFANLVDKGYKVYLTREPGGSPAAEEIRSIFLKNNSLDAITETLLVSAARRDHWFKIIKPKLAEGYVVISDRFYDSTLVYQGLKAETNYENVIRQIIDLSVPGVHPDLTLFFNVPHNVIMERLSKRNEYNAQDVVVEQRIKDMSIKYLEIANSVSYRSAIITDDGTNSIEFIANNVVLPLVVSRLPKAGTNNGN